MNNMQGQGNLHFNMPSNFPVNHMAQQQQPQQQNVVPQLPNQMAQQFHHPQQQQQQQQQQQPTLNPQLMQQQAIPQMLPQQQHQQQGLQQQPQQQQQQQKEVNTASLCRIGQDTVQELVSRTQEIFQILRNLQPPNGTQQSGVVAQEKKSKLQEQLKTIKVLFKRLRIIYDKCNENSQDLENQPLETMIPTRTNLADWKYLDKKNTDNYRTALEERKELYEQIVVKNRQLQEMMDYMRSIIWEINTMLLMRKP